MGASIVTRPPVDGHNRHQTPERLAAKKLGKDGLRTCFIGRRRRRRPALRSLRTPPRPATIATRNGAACLSTVPSATWFSPAVIIS
jgi:hypothetical protein